MLWSFLAVEHLLFLELLFCQSADLLSFLKHELTNVSEHIFVFFFGFNVGFLRLDLWVFTDDHCVCELFEIALSI